MSRTIVYMQATPFGLVGIRDYSDTAEGFVVIDASTQAKFDAAWATYIPLGNVTFIYSAGTFQTKGWQFSQRETVFSGNIHIGAGIDKTILQLVGASSVTGDGVFFARDIGTGFILSNWACYDMTLDSNATNQPKWTQAPGPVGAISLPAGNNIVVQRVKFINFGTTAVGRECFPCSIFAVSGQSNFTMTGVVIDNCIFTSPATGNLDGVTCAAINDNNAAGVNADNTCIVSNCQFLDVSSDFSYSHSYGAPVCFGNYSRNCQVCYYSEPTQTIFSGVTILLRDNTGVNVQRGVYFLLHSSAVVANIVATGEHYTLQNTNTACYAATAPGASPKGNIGKIILAGNTMIAGGSTIQGCRFNESGTVDMTIQQITIRNNTFIGFGASNYTSIDASTSVVVASSITANDQF